MDYLLSVYSMHSPEVVCVSKTWLSPDILDSELHIPNYHIYCRDWYCRASGWNIYVSSSVHATPLSSIPNSTLVTLSHFKVLHLQLDLFTVPQLPHMLSFLLLISLVVFPLSNYST